MIDTPTTAGLLALLCALLWAPPLRAQDNVRLAEIVPALEGTELGALELGPAPRPGATRVVRRSEVLSALRRAGRETRGLSIPRSTRVRREARRIEPAALQELAHDAVARSVAPCRLSRLEIASGATVAMGDLDISAEGTAPQRSGSRNVMVVLRVGGREVRVPARTEVTCPAPVIRPGARVRIIARFGAVEASSPGTAAQPGRVGDIIRVRNPRHGRSIRARVIDAHTVEVVP